MVKNIFEPISMVTFWHNYGRIFNGGADFVADVNYIDWIAAFCVIAFFLISIIFRFTYYRPLAATDGKKANAKLLSLIKNKSFVRSSALATKKSCSVYILPFLVSLLTFSSFGSIALALNANSRLRKFSTRFSLSWEASWIPLSG
mmetsp:Transcript_20788/g.51206  ORF Transcript_20788/g.51206 Transcript_20788/m.51206 type:complete len:145 (+) Transcript_20788:106-540(+)